MQMGKTRQKNQKVKTHKVKNKRARESQMNSIFSIDDFSDPFWEAPPPLNSDSAKVVPAEEASQSQPEWTFEMFLEEISSSVSSEPVGNNNNNNAIVGVSSAQSLPSVSGQNDFEDDSRFRRDHHDRDSGSWDCAAPPPPKTVIVDSDDDYHRVLKNKLETECATAVALRECGLTWQISSLMSPGEFGVSSSVPSELKKSGGPTKQVTSGSSREYSDDDDLDEENETSGSLKPEDVKKSRRMLSNRESARRSRRRKQEQTSDLETQVNELKGEHSSLLKQLSNMNHKYDDAAVGNRILKADIETLRAKVKMAEETVKRVTGMNPLLLGRSNGYSNNNRMPLTGNNRMDSSCIPAFQLQSNLNHLANPNIGIPTVRSPRVDNNFAHPPSLNSQTNSHLQRIRNGQNHHVAPSTSPYAWNTEAQNDSACVGLAKVGGRSSSVKELEVAIVKATRHDEYPAEEKYVREILSLTSYSRNYVSACVIILSRRLNKTKNWSVALKTLILIQRLLRDGDRAYEQEIFFATRRGTRLLNMSDFRDANRSDSWDYSAFVRTYALYLDERLDFRMQGRRGKNGDGGDSGEEEDHRESNADNRSRALVVKSKPVTELKTEKIFTRVQHLQQLLDRFLACRPTGNAKNDRVVIVALYPIVKESFQIYYNITEIMGVLIDRFMELDIHDSIKVYDIFCRVSKQLDELDPFYGWCKNMGVARSSEYPELEKITQKKLDLMDEFIRDKSALAAQTQRSSSKKSNKSEEEERKTEEIQEEDPNSMKALPAPPEHEEEEEEEEEEKEEIEANKDNQEVVSRQDQEGDLLDLSGDAGETAGSVGDSLALALFDGAAATETASGPGWEAFNDDSADWETALVTSATRLSGQKSELGGGFDKLLLDGMYQYGAVNAAVKVSTAYGNSGSASSVAFGSAGRPTASMLALTAPPPMANGNRIGSQSPVTLDPFAASLEVAPPPYVQMNDMEKKQRLLMEEQMMWDQYNRNGRLVAEIHKHLMVPWNDLRKGDCCGRFEAISDGYYCKSCDFFVHKKCGESSTRIQHPSHPNHTLFLDYRSIVPHRSCNYCDLCGKDIEKLCYRCGQCDFDVHLHCTKYPPLDVIDVSEMHPHKLTLFKELIEFECSATCGKTGPSNHGFPYKCHECDSTFHVDCLSYPSEVNHSYHSLHPLKLLTSPPGNYFDGRCRLCGKEIYDKLFYHCSSCNFSLDVYCVSTPPPQSLVDLKVHHHKLLLLPRLDSFTCNACGLKGDRSPYVCVECGFMIHQDCLSLPRLININRHEHRVSRTSVIGVVNSVCGVCRKKVDWTCGGYSCHKCHGYVVHSKCATRRDVWNGKELEGEPEEPEDEKPYVVIDANTNTIQHFSHKEHYLRLKDANDDALRDDNKHCNACTHPISLESFYGCMDCDFVIHQNCAGFPTRKRHVLHNDRLTLVTDEDSWFCCDACYEVSNGFRYRHRGVRFDVLCGSISEPFAHPSHPLHPLYYIPHDEREICNGCNLEKSDVLRCIEDGCVFILCFKCATLPQTVNHRVDDDPLSLCYGEEASGGKNWCDICEKEANPKTWFYTCVTRARAAYTLST
ncbi:unnamed protein product [Thlaspi arvense]|uniref:Uncharacterized protein n=1 Tax=Thlaspi arvense TaxID=13288 RepID=A0AAU9SPD2_THLAR|nr:unnamed protein product [Thlaspi arvense]